MYLGGRRVSGVTRHRYSYTEHFKMAKKVLFFIVELIKILFLAILYLIVKHINVEKKADLRRKEYTCTVILFYNYMYICAVGLILALRVTKNQIISLFWAVCLGILLAITSYKSV